MISDTTVTDNEAVDERLGRDRGWDLWERGGRDSRHLHRRQHDPLDHEQRDQHQGRRRCLHRRRRRRAWHRHDLQHDDGRQLCQLEWRGLSRRRYRGRRRHDDERVRRDARGQHRLARPGGPCTKRRDRQRRRFDSRVDRKWPGVRPERRHGPLEGLQRPRRSTSARRGVHGRAEEREGRDRRAQHQLRGYRQRRSDVYLRDLGLEPSREPRAEEEVPRGRQDGPARGRAAERKGCDAGGYERAKCGGIVLDEDAVYGTPARTS